MSRVTASRIVRVMLAAVAAIAVLALSASFASAVTITPEGYTPPHVRVAVVRSQTTLDWLAATNRPNAYPHGTKERTVLEYLQGRGYNVTQIIGDTELLDTGRLTRDFDVVVLPAMYAMGKGASDSLVRYVAAGGGVVSMNGSPRVDPAHAPPPGTPNDMREWWWRVMGSNDWEWGPLTAVYQMRMVDDNFTPEFRVNPIATSPIVIGASQILMARGYNGSIAGMGLYRTPGAGLELNYPVQGGQTVSTYTILDAGVKAKYGGTYSSAISASYGRGRSVYFAYGVNDFLVNYNTALGSIPTASGVPQGEVAGAMMESAIQWVHQDAVTAGIDSVSPSPATTDTPVTFSAHATDSAHSITAWQWRSTIDGVLATTASFSKRLSPGIHTIYVKAMCSEGVWSPEASQWLVVGAQGTRPQPMYRFYNRKTGVHFYTASEVEKNNVVATLSSIYTLEGIGYVLDAASPTNGTPLYRFYNLQKGVHFYTASEAEKNHVLATMGRLYRLDGVVCNVAASSSGGTQPVYRFYNIKKGVHFYTADPQERDNVIAKLSSIYRYEGVAYYLRPPW